jgi:small subunit ribosomal protein S4
MGLVPTPFAARQFVSHGHVRVNGKKANIPSMLVEEGDVVEVREKSKQLVTVLELVKNPERSVPDYIEFSNTDLKGKFIRVPKLAEVPYPVVMQPNFVIEFYSR